ncbi:MAG: Mth938-like domain-containing protein [Candidatus Bathyarchaeia archaeon]
MIEHYDFGLIVINGKKFTSDVIVFPERVVDGWWRREGHKLYTEDLGLILKSEPKPQVLVVGTGYNGLLKVQPEVENTLKAYGIELIIQPTKEATQTFNKLLNSGKHVAGAFHLTC